MATMKLTQRGLDALAAPSASGKQELIWDTELKGFGVRVSGTSSEKSFVIQSRIRGQRSKRRDTIGSCSLFNLAQAREEARERLRKMRLGEDPREKMREHLTLKEALEEYLTARPLRQATRAGYRRIIEQHLRDWLEKPLREISRDMVSRRHLAIAAKVKTEEGTSGEALANLVFKVFRAIYTLAADADDELPTNPVAALKRRWFMVERRQRSVKLDRLAAFHASVLKLENKVLADYIMLLLYTGLRRREAATLTWEHVDFAEKTLTIEKERTKNGRTLVLPMSDLTHGLLVARRAIGRDRFIFPSNSRSGHIEDPTDAFAEIETDTGIKVSAHDLRRTFASVADRAGISFLDLKHLLNHIIAKSDVTGGYVIKADNLREPAQRVADKMREYCGLAIPDNVTVLRKG